MKCPIDQTTLEITERQGIEIDWCPTCRGVWLDRGELDKIIERSGTFAAPSDRGDDRSRRSSDDGDYRDDRRGYESGYDPRRKKKKRGSFLDDLFDF